MQHGARLLIMSALAPMLGGCLARTALDVVTAPVKVVSKGVDVATTSQAEADEKRGRALRQREARLGQLERTHAREDRRCTMGDAKACQRRDVIAREIETLLPNVPAVPR